MKKYQEWSGPPRLWPSNKNRIMIPRLEKSLCGCSLYIGSLILAWVYTILSLVGVVINAFMGRIVISEIEERLKDQRSTADQEHIMLIGEMIYGMILGICIIGLLINGLLLYGVYKRNFCLMIPHLIANGAGLCFYILGTFISFFAAFTSIEMFGQFISISLMTGFGIYFWLILYSLFRQLKEEAIINQNSFNKI